VEAPAIAATALPGQFVMVRCGDKALLRRPLSIHRVEPPSSPTRLALLFAVVGKGTRWLSHQEQGVLDLLGPLVHGFNLGPTQGRLLLVAGGIGIAPLAFLAWKALSLGHQVRLLAGAPTTSSLYLDLPAEKGVDIVALTEDGSQGRKGLATDYLLDFLPEADQVFACGPLDMYRAVASMGPALDKPVQVSLEVRMGCGMGACYGCTIKTSSSLKQVCRDGPVFELKEILWEGVSQLW
jgi:dihydroorotate dehydrogenase electron transfer subunit